VDCRPPNIVFNLDDFDSTELRIVEITYYKPGSHFQEVISKWFASSSIKTSNTLSDTLALAFLSLHPSYDQIIRLPYAAGGVGGREYRIRDISLGSETQTIEAFSAVDEDCALSCQFYLNDDLVTLDDCRFWSDCGQTILKLRR
jgi:hypothetical protein